MKNVSKQAYFLFFAANHQNKATAISRCLLCLIATGLCSIPRLGLEQAAKSRPEVKSRTKHRPELRTTCQMFTEPARPKKSGSSLCANLPGRVRAQCQKLTRIKSFNKDEDMCSVTRYAIISIIVCSANMGKSAKKKNWQEKTNILDIS